MRLSKRLASGPGLYALALGAGIAAGLGHAPFGLWPVSLLGFAAIFFLARDTARPGRVAWCAGAGYFGLTLHWIVEPFLVDAETHGWLAPFALILLAGGLALFWALAGWMSKRMGGPRALSFAVALAACEMLRGHIFTGFPWALPGYIWVDTPVRLSVGWWGSYGLTLLTLLAAALPAAFTSLRPGLLGTFVIGLLALMPWQLDDPARGETDELGRVRIIQPDIAQAEKWDPQLAPGHFERMLELSRGREGDTVRPDLVIWPEAALVTPLDLAGPALERIGAVAGTVFITGVNRREGADWFNTMAVVGAEGAVQATYDKVHLVPFGEYIPFRLSFVRQLAGRGSNGFKAGEGVRLIGTPLGRALPLICYEGIFPGHLFRAGERADYLLLLTNDAWFGTFAGPQQHLVQARFRAAEHRLPLVRVANKGVSAVIDQWGNDPGSNAVAADRPGYVDSLVTRKVRYPLYARTGDWPVAVLLFLAIVSALFIRRRYGVAHPASLG